MAVLGVVSPFCSYLAIPIAAALILSGVKPAPVFAFLCSTPLMNPTLFAMTWSVFGWQMAVARAVAAVGFGVVGGMIAFHFSEYAVRFIHQQSPETANVLQQKNPDISFLRRWMKSAYHLGTFAVKYVFLGVLIAALIKELIPMQWVELAVGRQYGYGIIIGALLGVPLHACGGGTIPLIQVLMSMGMDPGSALAFFIAGPALRIPNVAALQMTAGSIVTGVYVILCLFWSVLFGIFYHYYCLGF